MLKTLLGIFGGRALQQVGVPVLVNLRPFDVALQLINATGNSTGVDTFTLQGVVSDWMTDGFEDVINRLGAERFSDFDSVFLTFQENRRLLRSASNRELQSTFLASYSGVSVWKTTEGSEVPTEDFVASIQLEVTRTADSILLESLRNPSLMNAGLGENVLNVRAQISSASIPTSAIPSPVPSSPEPTAIPLLSPSPVPYSPEPAPAPTSSPTPVPTSGTIGPSDPTSGTIGDGSTATPTSSAIGDGSTATPTSSAYAADQTVLIPLFFLMIILFRR